MKRLKKKKNLLQGVNSALSTYFFGYTLKEKLTIEKFLLFQQQLQQEILSLEVREKNTSLSFFRNMSTDGKLNAQTQAYSF